MRLGHSCFGDHFILSCGYIGIMRHHWVIETHIKSGIRILGLFFKPFANGGTNPYLDISMKAELD
jgi:hypothetical protein